MECLIIYVCNAGGESYAGQAVAAAKSFKANACSSLLDYKFASRLVALIACELWTYVEETVWSHIVQCSVPRGSAKCASANEGETGRKSETDQATAIIKSIAVNGTDRRRNVYRYEIAATAEQA